MSVIIKRVQNNELIVLSSSSLACKHIYRVIHEKKEEKTGNLIKLLHPESQSDPDLNINITLS